MKMKITIVVSKYKYNFISTIQYGKTIFLVLPNYNQNLSNKSLKNDRVDRNMEASKSCE